MFNGRPGAGGGPAFASAASSTSGVGRKVWQAGGKKGKGKDDSKSAATKEAKARADALAKQKKKKDKSKFNQAPKF